MTMNAPAPAPEQPAELPEESEVKLVLRAANRSWLRYPLLVATVLLLAVVAIRARQLTEGILAAVEPAEEFFNLPF